MSTVAERLRAKLQAAKRSPQGGASVAEAQSSETNDSLELTSYISVVTTDNCEGQVLAFKNDLLELEEKLNKRVENFPYLLQTIHQHLRKDPALNTSLTDEEIGLIVRGLKTMKGAVLGTEVKSTGKRTSKKMPVTADML